MVINPVIYDAKGKGTDIFSSNLENRIIHLVGEVTDEMAASIVAQLLHLASQGEEVTADTERDYWMSAKEALEYGIVDKMAGV